jgi:hypothetical protein
MGLNNEKVREHMNALFEADRAEYLRGILPLMSPEQRELTVVEELCTALKQYGGKYVLPFRFRNSSGTRTSHYLFFVSKHFKGYEIMKEIMAKESSSNIQGVASFEYCLVDTRQPFLFSLTLPLDKLGELLAVEFAGKSLRMKEIYLSHSVGRRYIKRNYKDILTIMEKKGQITAIPPMENRPKRKGEMTFGDDVEVTFPARKNG